MAIRVNRYVLLGKKEVTYGSDPSPTKDNVINARNIVLDKDFGAQNIKVGDKSEFYSNLPGIQTAKLSFDVFLTAEKTAGTESELGELLDACGYGISGTDNYNSINDPQSSSSMYFYYYEDGLLHKVAGARGTATFQIEAGIVPFVHFEFTGLYVSGSAEAIISIDAYRNGTIFVAQANTLTLNSVGYHSYSLEFTDGNKLAILKDATANYGVYRIEFADAEPKGKVDAIVETANIGTLEALVENGTAFDLVFEKDTGLNPAIVLNVIAEDYARENDNGILRFSIPFIIKSITINLVTPT